MKAASLRLAICSFFLALLLIAPGANAQFTVVVQFDPDWTPPPGAGTRDQATAQILAELRSKFAFAGTTIQIVTSGAANHTLRYINSNSTRWLSAWDGAANTTAIWGVTTGHTSWVFGSEFNNETVMNNSTANARGQGATGAHEVGHGLNATHANSGIMKTSTTPEEKANTARGFDPDNTARMLSAARVGGAAPAAGGHEDIEPVYSQSHCDGCDPAAKLEDQFFIRSTVNMSNPNFDFGYINGFGQFIAALDPFTGSMIEVEGGQRYNFAIRDKVSFTQVYPANGSGASNVSGPSIPASNAYLPVMTQPYNPAAILVFHTPGGDVNVNLLAEGLNGFTKAFSGPVIPNMQTWGMIILLATMLFYGLYRIESSRRLRLGF